MKSTSRIDPPRRDIDDGTNVIREDVPYHGDISRSDMNDCVSIGVRRSVIGQCQSLRSLAQRGGAGISYSWMVAPAVNGASVTLWRGIKFAPELLLQLPDGLVSDEGATRGGKDRIANRRRDRGGRWLTKANGHFRTWEKLYLHVGYVTHARGV
jgi:hypothetical protein